MMLAVGIIHDLNFFEIIRHPWFISAFAAAGMAQLLKFLFCRVRHGVWRTRELFTAGGMPSSHSALVSALAAAVGITDGFDAPYAMIAAGLGFIVLCDAATLRRQAGEHAKLLNHIIERMNVREEDRIEARRLEEQLGHRRREVVAGVLLGIVTSVVVCAIWDFWK